MINNLEEYKIALVICCDNVYINNGFAIAAIKSFLYHNKWFNGDIVLFDDHTSFKVSNENKELIKSLYKNVVVKDLDLNKYSDILRRFNNVYPHTINFIKAYPKLEVFNLSEYDKVLCIDADILFVDNIKELFEQNISFGVTSATLINLLRDNYSFDKFKKYDEYIVNDSGGFNAGVMYFGNKKLLNITNEILYYMNDLIRTHASSNKQIYFWEQCMLSYFFQEHYNDDIKIINPIYNVLIGIFYGYELLNNIKNDFILNLYKNAKIYHYIFKPNNYGRYSYDNIAPDNYFQKLWDFYYNMPNELITHEFPILDNS